MSDNALRHLIAFVATVVAITIYIIAYTSGIRGWWITGVLTLLVYAFVYRLVDA